MRSLLFVPGDSERKLGRSLACGADVLVVDLEDSVAAEGKQRAREMTAAFLAGSRRQSGRPQLYVRVNDLRSGHVQADLDHVMAAAPDGIMLPKSESGRDLQQLHARLDVHEAEAGLAVGTTRIVLVATETAASMFGLGSYAGRSDRLAGMAWGAEDLSADLGAATNRDNDGGFSEPFRLARNLCLFGACAAGAAPIDTVYTNFRDLDGLARECREAERDGFTAKLAIHPDQVAVINTVFTPSAEAVDRARRIVEAFARAGDPGVLAMEGDMLDRPHLRRAERILARAGAAPD